MLRRQRDPATTLDAGGTDASTADTSTDDAAKADAGKVLPFTPSNLDLSGLDLSNVGDVVIKATCIMKTGEKSISCDDDSKLAFKLVTQPGGSQIAVYVAKSFQVAAGAELIIDGTKPVALVALGRSRCSARCSSTRRPAANLRAAPWAATST